MKLFRRETSKLDNSSDAVPSLTFVNAWRAKHTRPTIPLLRTHMLENVGGYLAQEERVVPTARRLAKPVPPTLPKSSPRKSFVRAQGISTDDAIKKQEKEQQRLMETSSRVDNREPNPGLCEQLTRNKKKSANIQAKQHRDRIMNMQRRIREYNAKHTIDNKPFHHTTTRQQRFTPKQNIGDHSIRPATHDPKNNRIKLTAATNSRIIKQRINSCKQPPCEITETSSTVELLLFLDAHMQRNRLTVTDLFNTSDRSGNGSIPTYHLRTILTALNLGYTQNQITHMIQLIDSDEDGCINPIVFETLLRRSRWEQTLPSSLPNLNPETSTKIPAQSEEQIGQEDTSLHDATFRSERLTNAVQKKAVGELRTCHVEPTTDAMHAKTFINQKEFQLRNDILRGIVKQRLYQTKDLQSYFESLRRSSRSRNIEEERMMNEVIGSIQAEFEV